MPLQDSLPPLHEKLLPWQDFSLLIEEKVCPELHQANCAPQPITTWYLDNRASNHMTSDMKKFQKLDEGISVKVKFGDGSSVGYRERAQSCLAIGIGSSGCLRRCTTFPRCAATW